jgi:hypothetical protein
MLLDIAAAAPRMTRAAAPGAPSGMAELAVGARRAAEAARADAAARVSASFIMTSMPPVRGPNRRGGGDFR